MEGLHLQRLGLHQPHERQPVLAHERAQLVRRGAARPPRRGLEVHGGEDALLRDVRLEHVNDQPLVEHDVMRSPGPAARKRLVPPKRHNNNAAPPRWQNDRRTENAESFSWTHTAHEHEN